MNDQVRDAAHAGVQHVVGHLEGVGEGGFLVRDPEQVLIGNDDQGVGILLKVGEPGLGDLHAVNALELERLGHDADGEDAVLARQPGDDRCRRRCRFRRPCRRR